jgi:cell division protease FtsH
MSCFEIAKDKVLMGTERKSLMIDGGKRKTQLITRPGHTLVARKIPGTDPIHKVTIIPARSRSGLTQQLPTGRRSLKTSCSATII